MCIFLFYYCYSFQEKPSGHFVRLVLAALPAGLQVIKVEKKTTQIRLLKRAQREKLKSSVTAWNPGSIPNTHTHTQKKWN